MTLERAGAGAAPNGRVGRLRIEMALPALDIGGMETLIVQMARALAARGHDVGVTCLERAGDLAPVLARDGIRVSVVPTPGLRTIVRAPELARHFAAVQPDVLHAHNGVWEKSARAARLAGVPRVVFTFHGTQDHEPWYTFPLKRLAARDTDVVVAVSEPLRDYLVDRARVPAEKVRVLINGVDTDRFCPGPSTGALRHRLGLDDDAPLIGIVARLAPVKNHAMLIEAFARLLRERPDAHLALVGDGVMRPAIEAQIASLGLESRVHMPGMITDLPEVYRDLDVFALSSLAEGTSVSMLEAMASARSIVATAVGGNPRLLDDGACGTLVPSDDAEAMARALAGALADPVAGAACGAAARDRALAHFSAAAMLDEYEAIYSGRVRRELTVTPETVACVG